MQIKPENPQVISLIFAKPIGFTFYAGQYLDIKLPVSDPNGSTRAFTISSSLTEDFLMITTKIGITPFKKYLESLEKGQIIESSHPAGTFILDETEPAIFLAGGIGITPFRSMIKYAVDQNLKTHITLIYSNSDDNFLFKEELEKWQKKLSNLEIIYHHSSQNSHLNRTELATIVEEYGNAIFYLAGSHEFVNAMEKILLDIGVDQLNIRYDRFDGY